MTQNIFLLFLFLIPVQLNVYFFPDFAYLNGLRSDLLSPVLYATDFILVLLILLSIPHLKKSVKSSHFFVLCFVVVVFIVTALVNQSLLNSLYGIVRLLGMVFIFWLGKRFLTDREFLQKLMSILIYGV